MRVHVVGPALEEGLVRGARARRVAGALERGERVEPALLVGGGRDAVGRQRHHRPVAAAHPHRLVGGERHHVALLGAGAQHQRAEPVVVADRDRVVPAGAEKAEVLQHYHRIAGRDLAQHVLEARRERVGNHAVAPRGGQHLDLQAALALRDVDLRDERFGGGVRAAGVEHRGERRRAALVFLLREERHLGELDLLRQAGRHAALRELPGLREPARAARQTGQNENARQAAGACQESTDG